MGGKGSGKGSGGKRPGAGGVRGPRTPTMERTIVATEEIRAIARAGRTMGIDVLERWMNQFGGLAARFQPPDTTTEAIRAWAETRAAEHFERFGTLSLMAAKELAKYQSPTYKAVAITPPPDPNAGRDKRTTFTLQVFSRDIMGGEPETIEVAKAGITAPAKAKTKG